MYEPRCFRVFRQASW